MKGNGKQNYGAADRARQHGTTVVLKSRPSLAGLPTMHWGIRFVFSYNIYFQHFKTSIRRASSFNHLQPIC